MGLTWVDPATAHDLRGQLACVRLAWAEPLLAPLGAEGLPLCKVPTRTKGCTPWSLVLGARVSFPPDPLAMGRSGLDSE